MSDTVAVSPAIIRTERGLTIAGTRKTLYNIMDYLKVDWPPQLIQQWLLLTETQMIEALNYIEAHRDEVEAEYQTVIQQAYEIRTYWEERNRERLAYIATLPPKPGREALYEKIKAHKAELGLE